MSPPIVLANFLDIKLPSPVSEIDCSCTIGFDSTIKIKRDDLIHPIISGNKFRKLSGSLQRCLNQGVGEIVSFGGAYSNHLHALSYCCHKLDIRLHAIVRGERPTSNTSPTLMDLQRWGAELQFVSRSTYRLREQQQYLSQLRLQYPDALIIPEGGSNDWAHEGLRQIWIELEDEQIDILICPIGSGGTFRGLLRHKPNHVQLIGVSALKGIDWPPMFDISPNDPQVRILENYHFGGFAKTKPELLEFIVDFERQHNIPLEPIYSAKMMYALIDQLSHNPSWRNKKICALHTGGLQGKRSQIKSTSAPDSNNR